MPLALAPQPVSSVPLGLICRIAHGRTARVREQLLDPRIARRELLRFAERLDRSLVVALLEERLALQRVRRDGGMVELERDSHLGEHLVVALEREQRALSGSKQS